MANTVQLYTSQKGQWVGVHYVCYGDGVVLTDLTDQVLLDTSADLSPVPTKLAVEKINIAAMTETGGYSLKLEFDDTTDQPICFVGSGATGQVSYNFDAHGQDLIVSPTIAGATGDVLLTTVGTTATAGHGFTVSLLLRATV